MLPVLEIFGPTIQGEGAVIGIKTVFVRLAGCDYSCVWCDSKFTWDGSAKHEIVKMTVAGIVAAIDFENVSHITISGGNPALYDLDELISAIHEKGASVGVETQGSRWQPWLKDVDYLTLSPKPPSSGMSTDFAALTKIISESSTATIKVVIFNDEDYEYAQGVHAQFPQTEMFLQVGNGDVQTDYKDVLALRLLRKLEWLIDKVAADPKMKSVRVLPQLHTLLWGNKRGV